MIVMLPESETETFILFVKKSVSNWNLIVAK